MPPLPVVAAYRRFQRTIRIRVRRHPAVYMNLTMRDAERFFEVYPDHFQQQLFSIERARTPLRNCEYQDTLPAHHPLSTAGLGPRRLAAARKIFKATRFHRFYKSYDWLLPPN